MINTLKNSYLFNIPLKVEYLICFIPIFAILGNWVVIGIYLAFVFFIFTLNSVYNNNLNLKIPYLFNWFLLLLWGIYIAQKSYAFKTGMLYYLGTIIIPFLLYLIINEINITENFLGILFKAFIISGVVLGIASILIFIDTGFDSKIRIHSLWEDNNIFSFYLLIVFMFNFSILINRKKGEHLFLYLVSILIILFGIFLSQTRGVWLSLVFAFILFLIKKPKLLIPISIFMGIFVLLFFNVIQDRFLSVKYFGNDISSLGRLQAWLSTIILLKNNLFTGYGFDSYIHLKDQVFSFYFVDVVHSHNTYLRTILEMGLIGFILYFFFIFNAFKYIFSRKSNSDIVFKKYIDGFKLSFLAFIPAFIFEPYLSLYGVTTITIWLLISIILRIKSQYPVIIIDN